MKPTGTRHDTLSQFCNEFGIVGAVSDPLQIFHQIVLLRAAEIEVELCVVVVHHIRQCRNPSVVESRLRISKEHPQTQCDGNQHLRLGFGARPVRSLPDTRAVHAARGFDELVVATELPLRAKLVFIDY